MSQVYMTAKLNLADGTILYPQVSLDNIVASISDPTLVTVATTTNGKVPVAQLPTTLTVTESNTTVPTAGAVYSALGTKQDTLTPGDNIIQIINGSTIMADITNLDVAGIDQTATNGVHLVLEGNTVSAAAELATDNSAGVLAGATNGVQLVDGVAQFDVATAPAADGTTAGLIKTVGDGLLVEGGTAHIDEASVETTLQDVRIDDGSTVSPVDDQVITPGNLRGALSVGQAVDVSCEALAKAVTPTYNPDFLHDFYLEKTNATTNTYYAFGFQTAATKFPKSADGLKYLAICDFRNSGDVALQYGQGNSRLQGSDYGNITGKDRMFIPQAACAAGQTQYTRLYCLFRGDEGLLYLQLKTDAAGTLHVDIKNWRQYEVTALTDEAIAYIAQLPDPDAFFRSTSVYSLRDKYLVKQDMVCPFIHTISMPDNSDLTIAAGLSYKIRYTNDNPHTITADTIPVDAHGWDTHVQMFIKGTSSIVFQQPLILMDALTPNAGHNLLVKWRNGDAFVYVEDTNAGYIVTEPSGTGAGTLNFGIVDPNTDYVIFAIGLDGTTVDAGTAVFGSTATTLTTLNVLGNGTDATTITGNIGAASGKTINFQDLTITGSTFNGAGDTTLRGTAIEDIEIVSDSTVYLYDVNVLESTVSGAGRIYFKGGSTVTSDIPSGSTIGTGVINNSGDVRYTRVFDPSSLAVVTVNNITFNPSPDASSYANCISISDGRGTYIFNNCVINGDGINDSVRFGSGSGAPVKAVLNNCTAYNITGYVSAAGSITLNNTIITAGVSNGQDGKITVNGCTVGYIGGNRSPVDVNGLVITGSGITTTSNITRIVHIIAGSTVDYRSTTATTGVIYGKEVSIGTYSSDLWVPGGSVTFLTKDNKTVELSGCQFSYMTVGGGIYADTAITLVAMDVWTASNATFLSPLDAHEVGTMKLSGTPFTSGSLIADPPARIQLVAGTTVSFQGNSNAADTKILEAPVILVGDNAAAPSGSATVVNAAGTTSTVSGIGTYIDKEGDNDFVALSNVSTVSTSATSGAGSLPAALTGSNKFVRLGDGTVGTVGEATNAVDKTVMTNEYEPIIGGTFSLTSATVNEATKTTTILEGGTMSIVDIRGGKDSMIDLGETSIVLRSGAHATFSNTKIVNSPANGALFNAYGGKITLIGASIASAYQGVSLSQNNPTSATVIISSSILKEASNNDLTVQNGICEVIGSTIGKIWGYNASNSVINFSGTNKIGYVRAQDNSNLQLVFSSGAILDLTGNTNATPIAPGGGITFESGGATVKVGESTASSSYMMDNVKLPAGAKLTNTAVVDLNKSYIVNTTGLSISGVTISNGSSTNGNRGGIEAKGGTCIIDNCLFTGNEGSLGAAVAAISGATVFMTNVVTSANTGVDVYALSDGSLIEMRGCNIGGSINVQSSGAIALAGENTINKLRNFGSTSGSVTISSGAIINLTSSISPGGTGGIQVVGGACTVNGNAIPAGTYTSIDSNGQPT